VFEKTCELIQAMAESEFWGKEIRDKAEESDAELNQIESELIQLRAEVERLTPKLPHWTLAFQTYDSAGDDAECFCPICDCCLDDYEWENRQFKYCPECGQRIFNRGEDGEFNE